MNASDFTHFMKAAGGGSRMWIGLIVICILVAMASIWLNGAENRKRLGNGLFA
jgi:hypothetical protein